LEWGLEVEGHGSSNRRMGWFQEERLNDTVKL
jgi:hypothetical protein